MAEPPYVDGPNVRAYWQTTIDGPGTINMNGSGDIGDTIEAGREVGSADAQKPLIHCDKDRRKFGKRELLLPVKNGPFYGIKCTPWFLTTTGGIRFNDDMQVMDEDNEVIEGLYCLGSTVGDMYCNCYSTHFPGHNLGMKPSPSATFAGWRRNFSRRSPDALPPRPGCTLFRRVRTGRRRPPSKPPDVSTPSSLLSSGQARADERCDQTTTHTMKIPRSST